jgi:hypothetical protein
VSPSSRRVHDRFDAQVEGGPANGLRLVCERMSDGEIKVLGGILFDEELAGIMANHYFDTERGVIVYADPEPKPEADDG